MTSGDELCVKRLLLGELLDQRLAAGSNDKLEGCMY